MEFRKQTLDNGLEVIAELAPHAYSAAVGFFVKTGSRDETDGNHGVSHFLEHMAFKGTATRSAADVNRELDEIGSHSNAYTSEEQTVYFAAFLPEYHDQAVELLSDILRPALRQTDFDTEKMVILEEIAKYEDQPPFGAHEKCMAAHFGAHPLGRSVLGTAASVGRLTRDQMMAYFRQRYSPRNIVLVAAGNVDFGRLVTWAQRYCGGWEPFDAPRETPRAAAHSGLEVFHKPAAVQQYVIQIVNGPALEDEDRYAGRLLATVLGDDSGSRMFWELVDPGFAESASMGACEYQGTGILMTQLSCARGHGGESGPPAGHPGGSRGRGSDGGGVGAGEEQDPFVPGVAERAAGQSPVRRRRQLDRASPVSHGSRGDRKLRARDLRRRRRRAAEVSGHRQHHRGRRAAARSGRDLGGDGRERI